MNPIILKKTERGFLRGDFKDIYHVECSIQESSLATKAAIWLGQNEGTKIDDGTILCRMHLDQELATELRDLLNRFIEQGDLRDPNELSIEERVNKKMADVVEALQWLIDDLSDTGEDRNPETGEVYDSCANAKKVLAKVRK